jgi:hypothetical protein
VSTSGRGARRAHRDDARGRRGDRDPHDGAGRPLQPATSTSTPTARTRPPRSANWRPRRGTTWPPATRTATRDRRADARDGRPPRTRSIPIAPYAARRPSAAGPCSTSVHPAPLRRRLAGR